MVLKANADPGESRRRWVFICGGAAKYSLVCALDEGSGERWNGSDK